MYILHACILEKKVNMHNEPRKNTTILLKISERVYRIEIFLHAGISTEIKTHFPACSTWLMLFSGLFLFLRTHNYVNEILV